MIIYASETVDMGEAFGSNKKLSVSMSTDQTAAVFLILRATLENTAQVRGEAMID